MAAQTAKHFGNRGAGEGRMSMTNSLTTRRRGLDEDDVAHSAR